MRKLIEHLEAVARLHGATLKCSASLRPLMIEHVAKNDFSRGVLSTVVEVYRLASQTLDGRQAIGDLGFEPLFQDVECE